MPEVCCSSRSLAASLETCRRVLGHVRSDSAVDQGMDEAVAAAPYLPGPRELLDVGTDQGAPTEAGDQVPLARWRLDGHGPPCLVLGQLITEQLGEQPHLVPEVLEQAALGRAGRHGDLPGGDPPDSLPLDQVQGGVKYALARRGR